MLTSLLLAVHCSGPTSAVVVPDVPAQKSTRSAEDARARAAFLALPPPARRDVVDLLALQLEHCGSFQSTLIAWVKKKQDRDPSAWHEVAPLKLYDPAVLAPAQPTPRHWLDADSAAAKSARAAILGRYAARPWTVAFRYDWASGELLRVTAPDESLRIFENALAGFAPDLDLVEALVERELDDHSFAKEAAAFGHAYTDRVGGAYAGITLYDAYASGTEFEMPDIDVLGLVRDLIEASPRWTAPIPSTQHEVIYPQIGERFVPYFRHRGLRTALARAFAVGDAVLDDGYGGMLDNLHALWEDCASTPETLRARLPKPAERDAFLESWTERCKGPDSPYPAGQRRHETLRNDAEFVRSSVFDALIELGALQSPPPSTNGDGR